MPLWDPYGATFTLALAVAVAPVVRQPLVGTRPSREVGVIEEQPCRPETAILALGDAFYDPVEAADFPPAPAGPGEPAAPGAEGRGRGRRVERGHLPECREEQ